MLPERENEVAAACETEGRYDEVVRCTRCGAELSRKTVATAALGHSTATRHENEVAATCEGGGAYELVTYCTRCGKVISREPQKTAALGHSPGAPVRERVGTDAALLYEDVIYCTRCGKELSRTRVP